MNEVRVKHSLLKFLHFAYKAYPPYFFLAFLTALFNAGLTVFNAYSLSLLIHYLETATYDYSIIVGGVIVAINFVFYFLNKLFARLNEVEEAKMLEAVDQKIAIKLMELPFNYLEDPYYLDLKERALFAVHNQGAIVFFLRSSVSMLQYIITIASLLGVMFTFDIWLFVIVFVALISNVIIFTLSMKSQMKFYQDLIPINRRYGYFIDTIMDEKKGKDYRMYPVGDLMAQRLKNYSRTSVDYFIHFMRKMSGYSGLSAMVKYLEMALVYGFVAYRTLSLGLSISLFSLYISTALTFSATMEQVVETSMSFAQNAAYIKPLVSLMEIKAEQDIGAKEEFVGSINEIEFRNVSFAYPHTDILVLDQVSFKINHGEKISLVGLNGAGKTTLIKLLCRLYKPNEGEIIVNGKNINDYDLASYIKAISAVFQDFKLFAWTIAENISNDNQHQEEAYKTANKVGLKNKIDALPEGINTLYSKIYDEKGVDLSGGESQKVAIARALYKDASLVILDEPTSALDPLAEADIYANFNSLVEDKTAIYISHRMSSSVFCDKVLVIDKGKVSDFDTHEHLMEKRDSLYYKLFATQAKNYQLQ
ncbi:MAG: ABC transporter ATP-binding protein/permease [Bacilli bacterium]|jgi:ATP-binding cassette subfamily B protein/ATP-binding cassette subfamily C protein|nr:ABC transporter ATP-binding protein/permease [Bacilli bacterium]